MATVEVTDTRVEAVLERATANWSELPVIEREFGTWDSFQQTEFLCEWPAQNNALNELAQAVGRMTQEQLGRYKELLVIVDRNRPIIERLLAS